MPDHDKNPAPAPAPAKDDKAPPLYGAARAVANYCLLPDPRSLGTRLKDGLMNFWRPSVTQSEEKCINDEIKGVAAIMHTKAPEPGSAAHDAIIKRARELAEIGNRVCHVRDFHDTVVVPQGYYGYRGADNQCHTTHNVQEARAQRCANDQVPRNAHDRLFLPHAPRRADSKGQCK